MNGSITRLLGGMLFVVLVIIMNSAATQFVAYRLSYHSVLGDPNTRKTKTNL